MTWLRSANFFSGVFSRAKSSSRLMIAAQRLVSRITRSRSSASGLPSGIFLPQQVREGQDAGQRVVQFMGDAGGEQADRGQLFAAHRLGLRAAQLLGPFFHLLLERVPPFPQLRLGIAQSAGHGIERGRQLAEFVVAAHRDRLLEIAADEPLAPPSRSRSGT